MNDNERNTRKTYGLKTLNCSPKTKKMVSFEKHLWDLVNTLIFRKIKRNFQRQLNEDPRTISRSNKVLVFANKTFNTYKLDKREYKKSTTEAVKTSNTNV